MSTFQDPYSNDDYIYSHEQTEVTGGVLQTDRINNGNALTFASASSSYASVPSTANLNGTSWTMSAWIKTSTLATQKVFGKGDTADYQFIVQVTSTGFLQAVAWQADGTEYFGITATTRNVADGQWHHVAAVKDNTTSLTIYVDGFQVGQDTSSAGTYNSTGTQVLYMGRWSAGNYFNGSLNDLRYYNTALTATEVYNMARHNVSPAGPQLLAAFDEGTGTPADTSANAYTITVSNTSWSTTGVDRFYPIGRTTSEDVLTGLSSTGVNDFLYTTGKKPGGSEARLQFSDDGSTWKNANGDLVSNSGGYYFDGVNDNISTGQTFGTLMNNATASMSCWLRWDKATVSSGTASNIPAALSDSSGYTAIAYGTVGSVTGIHAYNYDGAADVVSFPANAGQWYHATWVHTGGVLYLYVDGVLVGSASSGNTSVTTGTMLIGSNWTSATARWFQGNIDDCRFYNIALTATEIWDLYSRHKESYNSSTGLEGWYKLDGNANDSSGNGYNGSVSGATSVTNWYELPAFGEGATEDVDILSFDGVNDYVTIPDNAAFDFGTGNFSMGIWLRAPASAKQNYRSAFSWDHSNQPWIQTNSNGFVILGTTGNIVVTGTINVMDGRWHRVDAVREGTSTNQYKLYVDGVYNAQGTSSNSISGSISPRIGDISSVAGRVWIGELANATLYNDARTSTEVLTDFQNGFVDTSNANLVGFWPLNEGTGTTADNAQGTSALDGTITGATWTKDSTRPLPAAASQQTIDLTALGFTSAMYYRVFMRT